MALLSGIDVSDYIKKDYPQTVYHFLLRNNCGGNIKAYFMLFFYEPHSANQLLESLLSKVQNKSVQIYDMAADYTDKIKYYYDDIKVRKLYWQNILNLYKEFEQLIADNKTSYSMRSCFDFVFRYADKIYTKHGGVYKGSFDLDSMTIKNILWDIKNRH
jgi:hypothetical protein